MFVPRRTIECDELLARHGLLEGKIHHLNIDLVQLDEDLLSLELPTSFENFILNDDDTFKIYVQSSLQRLETLYGKIKYKYAKGSVSTKILQNLQQIQASTSAFIASQQQQDTEFDALIMLDRSVDLISPFCLQQTYEGSIDEAYGVETSQVEVDRIVLNPMWKPEPGQPSRVTLTLSNDDFIFKEVRSMSIHSIGIVTKQKLQDIMDLLSRKDNNSSIKELTDYVS